MMKRMPRRMLRPGRDCDLVGLWTVALQRICEIPCPLKVERHFESCRRELVDEPAKDGEAARRSAVSYSVVAQHLARRGHEEKYENVHHRPVLFPGGNGGSRGFCGHQVSALSSLSGGARLAGRDAPGLDQHRRKRRLMLSAMAPRNSKTTAVIAKQRLEAHREGDNGNQQQGERREHVRQLAPARLRSRVRCVAAIGRGWPASS